MAKSIKEFLIENPIDSVTETVTLKLKRKGKEEMQADFTVSMMSGEDFNKYQKAATPRQKHGEKTVATPSASKVNEMMVVNHCIEPDFRDAAWIEKAGVKTPEQLLYKVLRAGEISALAVAILELSGLGEDIVVLRDEVKNS